MLYADMGNVEYFISGDMDAALKNYEMAEKNKNDVVEAVESCPTGAITTEE